MFEKAKGILNGVDFAELNKARNQRSFMGDEEDAHSLLKRETPSSSRADFQSNFRPLAGTVNKSEQMRMKKLIFRASKGMAWVEFFDFDEVITDADGKELEVCLYFVIYPSEIDLLK